MTKPFQALLLIINHLSLEKNKRKMKKKLANKDITENTVIFSTSFCGRDPVIVTDVACRN